ncbi:hypothetical protein AAG570_008481 [Ranatra chinensis]|uniref:Uncharacterized protein n=1 Tax=Ranatra chinensis TaxID=642074 RepID=A0ABD0Z1T0_9HEMI
MAAISLVNPKAEYAKAAQALALNISAAKGLQEVMRTNLGPPGTLKMLVSEMQIQHPTAAMIGRASTAVDDIYGDGTTSTVVFIGVHPRILTQGFAKAQVECLQVLDSLKHAITPTKESLAGVCITSLRTKLDYGLGGHLADMLLDAVECLYQPGKSLDLHMVEIMTMQHKTENDSRLVKGLVLDHGSRHPNMPKRIENAYILTCNVSLEYEKTEVNSGFFYKSAEDREKLVVAERKFIDDRVAKIIALKKKVCDGTDRGFVVVNQKGIDPFSLDMLARENIMGLRRAKRRNMERLTLACGGEALNSFDGELGEEQLGFAKLVYEHVLGETKYTFLEGCKICSSVTVLLNGSDSYKLNQMKDAIRDGLRSIKNAIDDGCVVPACGAFEVKAYEHLMKLKETMAGKDRLGVQAYAEALLIIPKVIAANLGLDPLLKIAELQDQLTKEEHKVVLGIDARDGNIIDPLSLNLHDNFCVKRQILEAGTVIASNLLHVDEIMRAGLSSLK